MQTIGEERNIQTLFRELRLEDEHVAPRFSAVWNNAHAGTSPGPRFRVSLAAATALLVVSLFSFALWLNERWRNQQQNAAVVISPPSTTASPAPKALKQEPNQFVPFRANYRASAKQRVMSLAARRRVEKLALEEIERRHAVAISSWQSPTAMLMQSPADDLLTSLPQLYRSVYELNMFLLEKQE